MSLTAKPLAIGAVSGSADEAIQICAWCPELHVLRLDRKLDDRFHFSLAAGELLLAFRWRRGEGWSQLVVSHGICEACKAKNFPPTPATEGSANV